MAIGATGKLTGGTANDLGAEKAKIGEAEAFQAEISALKTASAMKTKKLETETQIATDAIKAA